MIGPGRYLLGVVELVLILGAAWHGASLLRRRWLPEFEGAPARLASGVIAAALMSWTAVVLGTVGLFGPLPYLAAVVSVGLGIHLWARLESPRPAVDREPEAAVATWVALGIAGVALVKFALEARPQLSAGMTGFDSTWYHGPFAAGFAQSGNTIDLHFIAPQFLAWFYPANAEIFHAVGIGAFGRDLLSPLLNIGWFAGCLLAAWCIGRPFRVAPWSLGLGAVALSVPALSDQAGEARNDIVGIFFLLAAVAIALNAAKPLAPCNPEGDKGQGVGGIGTGGLAVAGLAVGIAAGTKLNFLLPAAVLVVGLAAIAPAGRRLRAFLTAGSAALAGGGYWYLRNLVHTGNPLPWADFGLPSPDQALGGREAHSVLGYLTDGTVWSDWFGPGLHSGLWPIWPLLGGAALAGLVLCLLPSGRDGERRWDQALVVSGLVGLATALAWLLAPTSASGPEGMPRGFESGLRYLAPALVLGLVLLPAAPLLRNRSLLVSQTVTRSGEVGGEAPPRRTAGRAWAAMMGVVVLVVAVVVGYPVARHYLKGRYADPAFTTPGLNAAFAWARDVSDSVIATTSTRQYPLYGTDLSNRVYFVGSEQPHGGFEAPADCRTFREEVNAIDPDYLVASLDRIEAGKPRFPASALWAIGPSTDVVLKKAPTVVYRVSGPLDPADCP